MRIAVPKETTAGERRVALVPESCRKLIAAGYEIAIESSALLLRITAGFTMAAHGFQKFGWFDGPGLEKTGQELATLGFHPGRRLALQAAANETAVEAYRGVWLKFSPQFHSSGRELGFSLKRRLAFEADVLPRTHWNIGVSYYHDHAFNSSTSTILAQLHLYL